MRERGRRFRYVHAQRAHLAPPSRFRNKKGPPRHRVFSSDEQGCTRSPAASDAWTRPAVHDGRGRLLLHLLAGLFPRGRYRARRWGCGCPPLPLPVWWALAGIFFCSARTHVPLTSPPPTGWWAWRGTGRGTRRGTRRGTSSKTRGTRGVRGAGYGGVRIGVRARKQGVRGGWGLGVRAGYARGNKGFRAHRAGRGFGGVQGWGVPGQGYAVAGVGDGPPDDRA
jgi:hypothetical protein